LQMRKSDSSHSAAVALGVATGANDKMLRHFLENLLGKQESHSTDRNGFNLP
jgi:hypothetical protein